MSDAAYCCLFFSLAKFSDCTSRNVMSAPGLELAAGRDGRCGAAGCLWRLRFADNDRSRGAAAGCDSGSYLSVAGCDIQRLILRVADEPPWVRTGHCYFFAAGF